MSDKETDPRKWKKWLSRHRRPFLSVFPKKRGPILGLSIRAYSITSPRPFGGRGVGGEGDSNRCWFSQTILTFACPHPNPLPKGEGDFFGIGSKSGKKVSRWPALGPAITSPHPFPLEYGQSGMSRPSSWQIPDCDLAALPWRPQSGAVRQAWGSISRWPWSAD